MTYEVILSFFTEVFCPSEKINNCFRNKVLGIEILDREKARPGRCHAYSSFKG